MKQLRNIKIDQPFCWQSKAVLRMFITHYDNAPKSKLTSALALYTILTFIASNQESDKFQTSASLLCAFSGLSRPTVFNFFKDFEALGILEIQRHRVKDRNLESDYLLLSINTIEGQG